MCSRSSVENHCFFCFFYDHKVQTLDPFSEIFFRVCLTYRTRAEKKPPLSCPTGHPNNIQFIMTYSIQMSASELTKKTEMMGSLRLTVDRFEVR